MSTFRTEYELLHEEQLYLAKKREEHPELFQMPTYSEQDIHRQIGISALPTGLPKGFIKYSPLDFIVEEILQDMSVMSTHDAPQSEPPTTIPQSTIYQADLIKAGVLSTMDATRLLAAALSIDADKIGYAGVKDEFALTSQRITIDGVSAETITKLNVPGIILRNIQPASQPLSTGALLGNRFTILVRTQAPVDQQTLEQRVATIRSQGVINFYGPQRFYWPRCLAHEFGKHFLRNDLPQLFKQYFTAQSPFEPLYAGELRKEASAHYENWPQMQEIMAALPYTFRFELVLLKALQEPTDEDPYEHALHAMTDQARYWALAYSSNLTNRILSEYVNEKKALPETFPLLLTTNKKSWDLHRPFLIKDGTAKYIQHMKRFPFISFSRSPRVQTRIQPIIHSSTVIPQGVILCFDLQKGAYATNFLSYLFDLHYAPPLPAWVDRSEVDQKAVLGHGSITQTQVALQPYIEEAKRINELVV